MGNRILPLDDNEMEILSTPFCELSKEMAAKAFALRDRLAEINWEENKNYVPKKMKAKKITILDKDKLLRDGILSPLDQKSSFTNRHDWAEHLKANNCVEYGNDLNNHKPPAEIRGDFNCREELGKVTHQIMEKYGH